MYEPNMSPSSRSTAKCAPRAASVGIVELKKPGRKTDGAGRSSHAAATFAATSGCNTPR